MRNRFLAWTTETDYLAHGDSVLVGVSGGADSMCLLSLLLSVREELSLTLTVCHVNHGIRGEHADGDATFVEAFCKEQGIPCVVKQADVPAYVRETGLGTEEAARILRYRAFSEVYGEIGADKLAVAHNMEDLAETVLFRLTRGTGMRGMGGIREMSTLEIGGRTLTVIRPLLSFHRSGITAYLKAQGISWREDETNRETEYGRNRIRHEVLPELNALNPKAVDHIAAFSEQMRQMSDYLDSITDRILTEAAEKRLPYNSFISPAYRTERLLAEPEVIRKAAIHRLLSGWNGEEKDLTASHVEAVEQLLSAPSGREIRVAGGLTVRKEQHLLAAYRTTGEENRTEAFALDLTLRDGEETSVGLPNGETLTLLVRSVTPEDRDVSILRKNSCIKCFDYDKITTGLCLRTRKPGDFLVIHPDGGRSLLQDFFVNRKVPSEERERAVLLCEGSCVLWALHYRTGEHLHITENTKRVLVCTLKEK